MFLFLSFLGPVLVYLCQFWVHCMFIFGRLIVSYWSILTTLSPLIAYLSPHFDYYWSTFSLFMSTFDYFWSTKNSYKNDVKLNIFCSQWLKIFKSLIFNYFFSFFNLNFCSNLLISILARKFKVLTFFRIKYSRFFLIWAKKFQYLRIQFRQN